MAPDDVIYLIAPAGHPNFGDEYIAAAWLRRLAHRRPRSRVVLDCPNPGLVGVLHAGLHPRLTVTDTLFRLAERVRETMADAPDSADGAAGAGGPEYWDAVAARAEAAVAEPGILGDDASRFEPGLDLLRTASTIHALGGGWVNDIWPDKSVVLAAASAAAEDIRGARGGRDAVRLLATGMGLAPAGLYDATASRIWPRFDLLDVRDGESERIAREAVRGSPDVGGREAPEPPTRVTCTGDDAWAVLGSGDLEENGLGHGGGPAADRPIALCLQSDLLRGADPVGELADAVVGALRSWDVGGRPVAGRDIAVIEAIPGDDLRVWDEIARRAPDLAAGAYVVGFAELWDRGLPARAGQRWLSTRFHPHLIAAARGARGVALDAHIHSYYSVKHRSVTAAGSRWPVAGPADAAAAVPGPGMDAAAVERNIATKAATVEAAYPVTAVMAGLSAAAVKVRRMGQNLGRRARRL